MFGVLTYAVVLSFGVSSRPARVIPQPPRISPREAGLGALAAYDANADGRIDEDELKESPALESALERIDVNGDGALTASEIAQRISCWADSGLGRMSLGCEVILNGRPLEGAVVRFVPEEFLGRNMDLAYGVTDQKGFAEISIPAAEPPGIARGLYRVTISKPDGQMETIAAEYNVQTVWGEEIDADVERLDTSCLRYTIEAADPPFKLAKEYRALPKAPVVEEPDTESAPTTRAENAPNMRFLVPILAVMTVLVVAISLVCFWLIRENRRSNAKR